MHIGGVEYQPDDSLALIRLYIGEYLMTFEPGESTWCACVRPLEEVTHG